MSLVNKLIKNSMSNTAAFVVEAVVAFLMMPFVIKHLGDSSYGVWVLINALTGYLGLFKLGFRPSINKHVSQYKALNDFKGMNIFMGASLHIYIYVSVLIVITSIFVSYNVPDIFTLDSEFILPFQILILFAGIQSVFSLIGTAFGGVISGYQRYEINSGIEISVILIRAGIIVYFLPEFPDLYTMAAAHFSITILGYIVTIVAAKKIAPLEKLPIIKKPGKDILKVILKYNSISFSIAALSIIIGYLDSVIIGIILPLSAVTHYVVGSRLIKYCIQFLGVTTKVIAPAISELSAKDKTAQLNNLLLMTYKYSCVVIHPILLILLLQGDLFIGLWMGENYFDSYKVMQVLALFTLFIAPAQSINSYLYGLGMHKYLLYVLAIEMICSVPLSILLGNYYGAIGVAYGISIPRAIVRMFLLPLLLNKISKINAFLKFAKYQAIILLSSLPFIFTLGLFKSVLNINNWIYFIFQLSVCCFVYLISVYYIVLNSTERATIVKLFFKKSYKV